MFWKVIMLYAIFMGVDFRGYQLVVPAGETSLSDRYVAFFTMVNPTNPDQLIVFQVPFADSQNNQIGVYVDGEGMPAGGDTKGDKFLDMLQNQDLTGRRFVLNFVIANNVDAQSYRDRRIFVEALQNGEDVPPDLDLDLVPEIINAPQDLRP